MGPAMGPAKAAPAAVGRRGAGPRRRQAGGGEDADREAKAPPKGGRHRAGEGTEGNRPGEARGRGGEKNVEPDLRVEHHDEACRDRERVEAEIRRVGEEADQMGDHHHGPPRPVLAPVSNCF